ncbi:hypothetical protein B0G57_107126 [Trinickia symbiotica]|uniref:Uncharacterized protein n=1 Tax=Trinickia symbiotica TaxID=863227 RepID=A0A2N7X434_9BURK|nr:hypothetical protein [Trinickia symbiotica]PMS36377.1 hypothetical protein C0Z20_12945 [Trinickia symbiotica]PPK44806.1 hypothetical protein B0G57_107126 [Trinickia symbiotica]
MKPKTSFELFRWAHFVLLWLVGMTVIVIVGEIAVGPALQWLLYDIPYQLPPWTREVRMAVFVALFSFFIGTVIWLYEKKVSGR